MYWAWRPQGTRVAVPDKRHASPSLTATWVHTVIFERPPQRGGPDTGLAGGQGGGRCQIFEQARGRGSENIVAVHRSPKPRAMMPRRISLVPARSEKLGEWRMALEGVYKITT